MALNKPSTGPSTSAATPVSPAPTVQEYKIRVPKNGKKRHHVMRFNATLNVDFANWSNVKMERENNMKEFKGMDEDQPKFGAGSEFGRDAREEARRKKFGIVARKYKPEDQPWILKVGGKTGKKFKGIREGGVSQNAAYYVFTHAADGAIDAYPLQEWYNFQPIQRYKHLSAEEAEQEFGRRNKVMNYFSLMMKKRIRGDDAELDADELEDKKTKASKAKELKISDMDEWMDSDDDTSESEGEKEKEKDNDSDSNAKKVAKKKGKAALAKKKKCDVNDEAFEESDDGDEEGRERDYISDSSESESDHEGKANKELKGVAEEDALRKLLTSDEDTEEEKSNKEQSEAEDDKEKDKEAEERAKKLSKKRKRDDNKKDESSDFSSDSDTDPETTNKKKKVSESKPPAASAIPSVAPAPAEEGSAASSRSVTPTPPSAAPTPPPKRHRTEAASECGVSEEAVRRYLMRKPMTTTELLTKFKSKKSGVSSERLVETMTQILKRINPLKQTIKGKMYLSIKP